MMLVGKTQVDLDAEAELLVKKEAAQKILSRLVTIDAESARPLRAITTGTAIQADKDKLVALDAEAATLRKELATLGVVP